MKQSFLVAVLLIVCVAVRATQDIYVMSSDGKWCVESSGDELVSMWSVVAPSSRHTISNGGQIVRAICLSPNGRYIALSSDHYIINIWDQDEKMFVQQKINKGYHDPKDDIFNKKTYSNEKKSIHDDFKNLYRICHWSAHCDELITQKYDDVEKIWKKEDVWNSETW